jgi:hypothetical protein
LLKSLTQISKSESLPLMASFAGGEILAESSLVVMTGHAAFAASGPEML